MANHDDNYWSKNVLKLVFRIYISLSLIFSPLYLMNTANAGFNGWNIGVGAYEGNGKVGLEAFKDVMLNGQQKRKNSSFSITPPVQRIASVLAGGVGAVALAEAVTMLIGAGVDWVLDPANNQIVYKVPSDTTSVPPSYTHYWSSPYLSNQQFTSYVTAATALCNRVNPSHGVGSYAEQTADRVVVYCGPTQTANYYYSVSRYANPAYDPNAEEEEQRKTIPLETVAAQVVSNADSHSDPAQRAAAAAVVVAAAQDIVNEAEKDDVKARPLVNSAEAASSVATDESATGTASRPNTANPDSEAVPEATPTDIALEFPVFCNWAPIVCEAAQVAISFPLTISGYWTQLEAWVSSAVNYFREEPTKPESEKKEIEELEVEAEEVSLQGSDQCPQDSVTFTVMSKSVTLKMPYQPVCDALNFFKPAVLLVGAISSAFIISGVRLKGEDEA